MFIFCSYYLDEFIDKKVTSLNTTSNNRAVTRTLPVLLEYIYHVYVLLEEHHWGEENIWFPLVTKHLPEVEEDINSFVTDHKKFVEDLKKLHELLKGKSHYDTSDFQGLENIRTLWKKITEFILPHFQREEEVLSRELLRKIPEEELKKGILEIQKHAQSGPKSHLRLAIIFYTLDSRERQIFFHSAPSFLVKVVVPWFMWYSHRHFIPFFTNYP